MAATTLSPHAHQNKRKSIIKLSVEHPAQYFRALHGEIARTPGGTYAAALFGVMSGYSDNRKGLCFAKPATLAADTYRCKRTVRRGLIKLQALGIIMPVGRAGQVGRGRRAWKVVVNALQKDTFPTTLDRVVEPIAGDQLDTDVHLQLDTDVHIQKDPRTPQEEEGEAPPPPPVPAAQVDPEGPEALARALHELAGATDPLIDNSELAAARQLLRQRSFAGLLSTCRRYAQVRPGQAHRLPRILEFVSNLNEIERVVRHAPPPPRVETAQERADREHHLAVRKAEELEKLAERAAFSEAALRYAAKRALKGSRTPGGTPGPSDPRGGMRASKPCLQGGDNYIAELVATSRPT